VAVKEARPKNTNLPAVRLFFFIYFFHPGNPKELRNSSYDRSIKSAKRMRLDRKRSQRN